MTEIKWRYLIMDYGYTVFGTNDFSIAMAASDEEFEVIDVVKGYSLRSMDDINEYVEPTE